MATKLKNLRMTSVDLVRNGANQEADICLFKSAEGTEQPAAPEMNILKRFLAWLTENPADAEYEPTAPVEKADEEPCLADIYKSAITESLQSITADETLSATEKNDMIAKSLSEYHDAMLDLFGFGPEEEPLQKAADEDDDLDDWEWDDEEAEEVEKFNENHDALGRFASAGGGASGGGSSANAERIKQLQAKIDSVEEKLRKDEQRPGGRLHSPGWRKTQQNLIRGYNQEIEALMSQRDNGAGVGKSADIDEIEEV